MDQVVGVVGMKERNYLSLMGMSEMEWAVKLMVEKAEQFSIPFCKVVISVDLFTKPGELIGFCHLCINGWIESRYPNCAFSPTRALSERIVKRFPDMGPITDERWGPSWL